MRLLAIDTATEACSAALQIDGRADWRFAEAPREHGERLLAMIDELLAESGCAVGDLDALAFGRGPGAFTGVRIATGVAQGISFAVDLPVLRISTLAALAQGTARAHGVRRVVAALDARMGEVYWGGFEMAEDGIMQPVIAEAVTPPAEVEIPPGEGWHGAGTGWSGYPEALIQRLGDALTANLGRALPEARDMLPLARAAYARGEAVDAAHALPVYLRDRVADKPRQR